MKKIIFGFTLMIGLLSVSCANLSVGSVTESFLGENIINKSDEEKFKDKMKSYKLEAVIKTTKGDINAFLYPEAAPKNVASFVFLSQNKFYDNMKFHRFFYNMLVQTGDIKGDGTGNAGYYVEDEYASWLDFKNYGMIAMAKPENTSNTNSSQFFITITSIPNFDSEYTIIGELKSREDLSVLKLIRKDDVIKSIDIKGVKVNEFLENFKAETELWSKSLVM